MPSAVAVVSTPGARWKRTAYPADSRIFLRPLGDQLVGAAQFLAVIAEHDAALVDEAEAADIAVVARFETARVIVLAALDGHVLDPLAERTVGENVGRIGVGEHQRAVRGGGAQTLRRVLAGDSSGPGPVRRN